MSCLLSTHYYCIVYLSGSLSVLDGDLSSHLETWIYFTNRPTIEVLGTVLVPIGYADGAFPVFAMYTNDESVLPIYALSMILISLQALLTVVMALLKPDVRNMVLDLFTGCCCCCHNNSNNEIQGSQCNNHNSTISLPTQELEDSMPIVIHKEEHNKVDDDKARTTTQELELDLQMPPVDDDDDDDHNDPQHQV
mmetsp:Transcript_25267/g.28841  ORF Transcript_25267/g.28841 Transcript_25267/m.28841 type:complete len:194 (-) Transcript_25267:20-601(-)